MVAAKVLAQGAVTAPAAQPVVADVRVNAMELAGHLAIKVLTKPVLP